MSEIDIDNQGMDELATFVADRVGGRLAGQMVDEARMNAHVLSGALRASGRVIRRGKQVWRIIFGEGLPDAHAVYHEVGTGPHFEQPPVATDFSPLKGKHPGNSPAVAYIRRAVYKARGL